MTFGDVDDGQLLICRRQQSQTGYRRQLFSAISFIHFVCVCVFLKSIFTCHDDVSIVAQSSAVKDPIVLRWRPSSSLTGQNDLGSLFDAGIFGRLDHCNGFGELQECRRSEGRTGRIGCLARVPAFVLVHQSGDNQGSSPDVIRSADRKWSITVTHPSDLRFRPARHGAFQRHVVALTPNQKTNNRI